MRPWRRVAATAVVAAAWTVASRAESPTVVKTGAHYVVTGHGVSDAALDASLESAEAAWNVVAGFFSDAPVAPHPAPLQIHVYASFAEFKTACASNGAGGLAAERWNMAFPGTMTAYVWLRPECDAETTRKIGVTWEHRRRVAHEAAHLAGFERMPAGCRLPHWVTEGTAMCAEFPAMAAMGFQGDAASEPSTGRCMTACLLLRREGKLPSAADVLAGRNAPPDKWDDLAVSWAFFRFLLAPEQKSAAATLFEAARRTKRGPTAAAAFSDAATRAFTKEELSALCDAFAKFVDGLGPAWSARSGSFSVSGAKWVQWSDVGEGCGIAWREAPVGRPDYSVDGKFEILPGRPESMMIVLLGRSDAGYLALTFDAKLGLSAFDGKRGKSDADVAWKLLEVGVLDGPKVGVQHAFACRVTASKVTVTLDGVEALAVPVAGRDLTGPWGVGTAEGALGVWSDVALK